MISIISTISNIVNDIFVYHTILTKFLILIMTEKKYNKKTFFQIVPSSEKVYNDDYLEDNDNNDNNIDDRDNNIDDDEVYLLLSNQHFSIYQRVLQFIRKRPYFFTMLFVILVILLALLLIYINYSCTQKYGTSYDYRCIDSSSLNDYDNDGKE